VRDENTMQRSGGIMAFFFLFYAMNERIVRLKNNQKVKTYTIIEVGFFSFSCFLLSVI